ncbi:MAG TPA: PQQ-binding-like beta-propeller repeat protein [Terriglobales bacterium]|nr:PQQ-binding-like beta-propeller repeat protein [Terriglobales bacterium]
MPSLQRRFGSRFAFLLLVSHLLSPGVAQNPPGNASPPSGAGWKINFDGSGSSPVSADGVLYVGSADGAVYALDPNTGVTRWRFQTGEELSPLTSTPQVITVPRGTSAIGQALAGKKAAEQQREQGIRRVDMTPAIEKGTLFIGSGDRLFYALDAATGTKKWSYDMGYPMANNNNTDNPVPPAVLRADTVFFATDDGLHAIDALTGRRKWLFETWQASYFDRKHAAEGPVLGDNVILLTMWVFTDPNTQKSFLYAVDPESGKAKWVTSVGGWDVTAPTTSKGLVFFAVEDPGPTPTTFSGRATLYAINAADGQVKWKFNSARKYGTHLLIAGNTIYFGTDSTLSALELETGRQLWSFSADDIGASLQADDHHLYVVTHKGSSMRPKDILHALVLSTGEEKWAQSFSGSLQVVMVEEGVVYAGQENLHAMDAASGKELWSFKGGHGSLRLIAGGRVFLISPTIDYIGTKRVDRGYLLAIDAKTGKLKP